MLYAFARGGGILYVGAATRLDGEPITRPFVSSHHRARDLRPGDVVLVWRMATPRTAYETEARLIGEMRPPLNKHNAYGSLMRRPKLRKSKHGPGNWYLLFGVVRSLGTTDLAEACHKAAPLVEEVRANHDRLARLRLDTEAWRPSCRRRRAR